MRRGQTISSRYRVEAPLGSGGFSEVWRAVDLDTGRPVALKLPRAGRETEANPRIREEAAILRSLDHPNIVRILDSGVDEAGDFLVMELVEGPTLRDVLRESGTMSDEEVLSTGAALADALAAAHGRGFVHGDVKPENIIMSGGAPHLIDFGTARNLSDTLTPEELREIAGTLAYLAPELLTGEPLSTQSDVYALGVTLYEARSGRLPFAGTGPFAGTEGRRASPLRERVPDVDARLESAVMQALAIDPAWRPATAGEVRERLLTGRHDTVQLRPQQAAPPAPGGRIGASAAAAAGVAAASSSNKAGTETAWPFRTSFPQYDEWVESQQREPGIPRRALAGVALAALLVIAAFGATMLLQRDSGDPTESATGGEPSAGGAASTGTTAATGTVTQAATSTPSPTATPTTEPPTATPPPPTATPVPPEPTPPPPAGQPSSQQIETQLDADSGAGRVLQWYDLVVAGRFDEAYALWSERMKANFPRQVNLDDRWANTVSISVNDLSVVSQSGNRMTVAIDFVETLANGSSQRYVGSWNLIASNNGWLLDSPSF